MLVGYYCRISSRISIVYLMPSDFGIDMHVIISYNIILKKKHNMYKPKTKTSQFIYFVNICLDIAFRKMHV